jgi:putative SOS response-associated peptidase YedK
MHAGSIGKTKISADILAPYPAERMVAYPVSRRVNDPKNDDAKLIEPEPA